MGKISAIVLAAGASARMKGAQKLMLPWKKGSMVEATISQIKAADPAELIVVSSEETRPFLDKINVPSIVNTRAAEGMTTSIQCGVTYASSEAGAYMICLGDMPLIKSATYRQLMEEFNSTGSVSPCIIQPVYKGDPGQPVIFSASFKEAILSHDYMDGCKELVSGNTEVLQRIKVDDPGIHQDIDDREMYRKLR